MTTIDPDAVVDAIARLFPDGFQLTARYYLDEIAEDLANAIVEGDAHLEPLRDAVAKLYAAGRLRNVLGNWALSWSEQARRIKRALNIEERDAGELETLIANVLAGKTEKL